MMRKQSMIFWDNLGVFMLFNKAYGKFLGALKSKCLSLCYVVIASLILSLEVLLVMGIALSPINNAYAVTKEENTKLVIQSKSVSVNSNAESMSGSDSENSADSAYLEEYANPNVNANQEYNSLIPPYIKEIDKDELAKFAISSNGVTAGQIQEKIASLKAKGDSLTPLEQKELADYRAVLEFAQTVITNNNLMHYISQIIDVDFKREQSDIDAKLNELITAEDILAIDDIATLNRLDAKFTTYCNRARAQVEELAKYLTSLSSLPVSSQEKVAHLTDKIIENKNLLASVANTNLSSHEILRLTAQNMAIQSEISLKQYVLSNSTAILDLINQKIALYQNLVDKTEAVIDDISKRISDIRKSETLKEQREIFAEPLKLSSKHPLIGILLEQNKEYLVRLEACFDAINEYIKINQKLESLIKRTQKIESDLNSHVEYFDDTIFLSQILFNLQQYIPTYDLPINLSDTISDLRVEQYTYNMESDKLENIDFFLKSALLKYEIKEPIDDLAREDLAKIIKARQGVLAKLASESIVELNQAVQVQINYSKYQKLKDNLNIHIYEQMFWSPSSPQINLKWFNTFKDGFNEQYQYLKKAFADVHLANPPILKVLLGVPFIILFAVLLFLHQKIDQSFVDLSNKVGRFSKDTHLVTIKSLGLLALKTVAIPSLLVGIILLATSFIDWCTSLEESAAIDKQIIIMSLKFAGLLWFTRFYLAVIRPDSISEEHFNKKYTVNEYRNQRRIFRYIILMQVMIMFKLFKPDTFAYDVVGQVVTLVIIIALIAEFISSFRNKLKLAGYFWSKLVILLNIGVLGFVAGLIYFGYYYSAIRISELLIVTYLVMLVYGIVYDTIIRSLSLAARRLNFKRNKEAREAKRQEKNETSNDDKELIDSVDEVMPISEISTQSEQIVRYLLISIFAVIFYNIWADILQVIKYVETISLYEITDSENSAVNVITLMDLLVALYTAVITTIIIKNLHGVLEVLIFNRFSNIQKYSYSIITIVTYVLIGLAAVLCATRLGLSWNKLQWLVAALSVGLGFGLQEIFANFISGLILLFERPIRIGDVITINDHSGVVSKIRIRATTITDFDRKDYVVPNKAFITSPLINWSLNDSITRLIVNVQAGYGSNVEQIREVLKKIVAHNPYIAPEPECCIYFTSFGQSNLNFELRVYVRKTADRNICLDALNTEIYNEFNRLGIEIAFTQIDVYIKNTKTNQEIQVMHKDAKEDVHLKGGKNPENNTTKEAG